MCSIMGENVVWDALFLMEDKYGGTASERVFERQEGKIIEEKVTQWKRKLELFVFIIQTRCVAGVCLSIGTLSLLWKISGLAFVHRHLLLILPSLLVCSYMLMCSSIRWEVCQGRFPTLKLLLEIAKNSLQSCRIVVKCSSGEKFQKSQALRGAFPF